MARSLPPLTWFRAFESAARHLSFTAAADELGLTQSAISQQVHALETRFGCLLFTRKNRGLALTDEGRRLVPTVSQALGTLRMAAESFDSGSDQKLLTVATSVSIAQWYLVPRLAEFCRANDDAAVRLMTKVWPDEFVGTGVDVEIRFDNVKAASPTAQLLGSARIVTVCAPGLLRDDQPPLTADAIARLPLIQVVGTSDTWAGWATQRKFTGSLKPTYLVDSHGMAVDMARSGAGIALTHQTIAAPCLRDGHLLRLEPDPLPATDGYLLTVDPGVSSDLPDRFATWLATEIDRTEAGL